jgi:hypothetical protein
MLYGEQVAKRIPTGECHEIDSSTSARRRG